MLTGSVIRDKPAAVIENRLQQAFEEIALKMYHTLPPPLDFSWREGSQAVSTYSYMTKRIGEPGGYTYGLRKSAGGVEYL
jgi:hypothetical protein